MTEQIDTTILIVGAGLAGLMAAQKLREMGVDVLLVERGAQAGGRLATIALGPGRADVGAQFFTVRTPEFQAWVDRWRDEGLVFEWSRGWSDGSMDSAPAGAHPRYAVHGGMQALAEHLAARADVRLRANLTVITRHEEGWLAMDDRGTVYRAGALIVTPPVPQVLPLLQAGQVTLDDGDLARLNAITYAPCLAGIFWISGSVQLPAPGAIQHHNAAISWVADNQRKGISPEATLVTVHAGPSYSRELWRRADWEIFAALESALQRHKDVNAHIADKRLIRWRYAQPLSIHPHPYLQLNGEPLVFAGDAFGGPRVEGAARSGLAAAQAITALV